MHKIEHLCRDGCGALLRHAAVGEHVKSNQTSHRLIGFDVYKASTFVYG